MNMEQNSNSINFTTGPVFIPASVSAEMSKIPVSHRGDKFMKDFAELQNTLCKLTKAKYVNIMTGSGSLANEAMIINIKNYNEYGLIISNGEFGSRLIYQATKQGLQFDTILSDWGTEHDYEKISQYISEHKNIKWILFTYNESATGCLVNFEKINEICKKNNVKIFTDAMSVVGNVDVDFSEVKWL